MPNILLTFVVISTIITTIVNFIKPAYKKFAGKFAVSINIFLSLALWLIASFSVAPYLGLELNTGLLIILGLALWTGANIFYDIWSLLKAATARLKKDLD